MNSKNYITLLAIVLISILATIVVLISISLKRLESKEIGIRYDNVAKELGDKTEREGLHNGPPGFYFIIFPSVFESMRFDNIQCLNKDGVMTKLKLSYQFKAIPSKLLSLIEQFKDYEGYKKILNAASKAAVHESCSKFTTEMFQTQRELFQQTLLTNMGYHCDELHCELNDLQVINVERPGAYEAAVRNKEAAKEDINVAINERPRQILIAERELEEAKKQAMILLNEAETKVNITNLNARYESEALRYRYQKDLEIYKNIKEKQGLSNEALISYIGIEAIAKSKNDINLGIKSPALTSYKSIKDEL